MTPETAAYQDSLSFTISWSLLKLMSIELLMPSNHLILCRRLLLLPSIFPSIRVFSSESALCIRWPKNQSFSFSPSNEYSGLISYRMDWFDLLAIQGTLRSLLQHLLLRALTNPTGTKKSSFQQMLKCSVCLRARFQKTWPWGMGWIYGQDCLILSPVFSINGKTEAQKS